jgi:hypothetical protein
MEEKRKVKGEGNDDENEKFFPWTVRRSNGDSFIQTSECQLSR